MQETDQPTRRSLRRTFKDVTAITAGAALASTAGCFDLWGLGGGGGRGGMVPGGSAPTMQTITREDAHVVVEDAATLVDQLSYEDGRIIWIPSDAAIDMTGRDATIRNTTVASGRNEGRRGALIYTTDIGSGSTVFWGGDHGSGLFDMQENSRLSGVELRGPTYDYYDSPAVPGFIPFAPQSSRSGREDWRSERHARGVTMLADTAQIDNCEIWGWATHAVVVGNKSTTPSPSVLYSHFHNNMMTSFGYGVDCRSGNPLVYRCYFDAHRHAICGSGLADSSYRIIECTFGPHTSSHVIDQHRVGENQSGSSDRSSRVWRNRAGGYMLVKNCQIQATHGLELPEEDDHGGGRPQTHCTIRGVPEQAFILEGCQLAHDGPPDNSDYAYASAINQRGIPGSVSTGEHGYSNIHFSGNSYNTRFDISAYHQPEDSPYYSPERA